MFVNLYFLADVLVLSMQVDHAENCDNDDHQEGDDELDDQR